MSISSLANAAAARRPDMYPLGEVPRGLNEIAAASATVPMPAAALAAAHDGPSAGGLPVPAALTPTPTSSQGEGKSSAFSTALNVLFGYIPTEVLTLYVAVLAAVQRSGDATVRRPQWIAFAAFLVATPAVVWMIYGAKVKAAQKRVPIHPRSWPIWEMFAASVAYCAWAFALPNAPFTAFTWYSSALSGIAVLGASTILGLLAPFFQRPLAA